MVQLCIRMGKWFPSFNIIILLPLLYFTFQLILSAFHLPDFLIYGYCILK